MNNELFMNPPTLSDERIALVPMEEKHAVGLFQIQSPSVWDHMLSKVDTLEEMESIVNQAISMRAKGLALPFVVTLKSSGQVVGTTRLYDFNFPYKSCEIGYTWYGTDYQRTFVNRACKKLLLQFCFETLHFQRVQFQTDETNIRSQRAIERLGAVKEGILRKHKIRASGIVRNSVLYSIIDDEWPAVKNNLEKNLIQKNEA
ncbi:GNAT family N-acetyltransferase [Fictibacillus nanhaiensis]|uniref:GNAT family N-acetyltransferase n=1 Tax=Fictibacillus nanhaiensis TaxID=742169 RepID=UPI001C956FB1|nr:GNAT family protein [Fictibacillus nanhaiensis]MBY6037649.1 GNAT family N-acetyltransferase [Fictibacillus nanhaiensis]